MNKNNNLQYFIGKICTIFTNPINRNFKEENPQTFVEQPYHYFLGVVESVDEHGILVTQAMSGLKSFFFFPNLIAICEEEVLHPENESDAQIINEMKKINTEAKNQVKDIEQSKFIDIDSLSKTLKNIKN